MRVRLADRIGLAWQHAFRISLGRCDGRQRWVWTVARWGVLGVEMKVTSATVATRSKCNCEHITAFDVFAWRKM